MRHIKTELNSEHNPQHIPQTVKRTRIHVNKSSCRQVYKKRNNLGTFRKNFEVRYLEPVYNFSATLLQRNSLKYDERSVEWCISCLTHLEVALVHIFGIVKSFLKCNVILCKWACFFCIWSLNQVWCVICLKALRRKRIKVHQGVYSSNNNFVVISQK